MAKTKANIVRKYNLTANGILTIEDGKIGIEDSDTGEYFELRSLLSDFADRSIKLTVNYDEDYV